MQREPVFFTPYPFAGPLPGPYVGLELLIQCVQGPVFLLVAFPPAHLSLALMYAYIKPNTLRMPSSSTPVA